MISIPPEIEIIEQIPFKMDPETAKLLQIQNDMCYCIAHGHWPEKDE